MTFTRLLRILASTILAILLVVPATASAYDANEWVPPEGSAIDQYRETLPAPGGNEVTHGREKGDPAEVLGKKNAAKLEALGPDGVAAAAAIAATDPVSGAAGTRRPKAAATDDLANTEPASSGFTQIVGQATGLNDPAGGAGWLVALIVALSTIGAVVYAVRRRGQGGTNV